MVDAETDSVETLRAQGPKTGSGEALTGGQAGHGERRRQQDAQERKKEKS